MPRVGCSSEEDGVRAGGRREAHKLGYVPVEIDRDRVVVVERGACDEIALRLREIARELRA